MDAESTTTAVESWQRHAWDDSREQCVECGQPWPCDIAKAINFGIGFGKMTERFGRATGRFKEAE